MANVIKPKRSNTASNVPTTVNLASGELAVNMADKKIYINNGTSIVQVGAGTLSSLSGVAITTPATNQVLQYNGTNWVNATASGSGTVTSITAGTGLSGGTITTTGTIALANTAVTAGSYTTANITVDAQGRITAASSGTSGVSSVTGTAPIASSGGSTPAISISQATTSANGYLSSTDWNTFNNKTSNTGTVTSVAMTVPTGLSISGTPITTSGTLAVTLTAGYSIPTTASQTNWDTAYSVRQQWTGGSTNLVAATGRTSLGGTTVGQNFFTLSNPTAITFPRMNADNTVSALDAATFRTAIGAGTSSTTGTVTSVGGTGTVNGLTLTGTVTTSGNLTLGGTLAVTASNFASQTANTFLSAPNGAAGVPTFRAIVVADIPTLNQNTTGTAATITGVYGGTITSAQVTTGLGFTPYNSTNPNSYIALGSAITGYTAGTNTALAATDTLLAALGKLQGQVTARGTGTVTGVTATAPVASSGGTAPVISMSAASAGVNGYMTGEYATKLNGIATGATANTGTVTSVSGTGTASGLSLSGTVTTSGNITLSGTVNSLAAGSYGISVTGSSASCTGNAATATTATNQSGGTVSATSIAYSTTLTGGTGVVNLGSGQFYKDASGNIGMGTSSPFSVAGGKTLQVVGADYSIIAQSATTSTANYANWRQIVRGSLTSHVWQLQLMNDANNAEQIVYEVSRVANQVNFQRWFGGTTEALRLTSSGGVSFGSSGAAYGTAGQILQSAGNAPPTWVSRTGSVLQVVHASTSTQATTTSGSPVGIGLSASITPSYTTSKILAIANVNAVFINAVPSAFGYSLLFRNGGNLAQFGYIVGYTDTAINRAGTSSFTHLDSPNTTSATTYEVMGAVANGGTANYQRDNQGTSTLTLMEIGG